MLGAEVGVGGGEFVVTHRGGGLGQTAEMDVAAAGAGEENDERREGAEETHERR